MNVRLFICMIGLSGVLSACAASTPTATPPLLSSPPPPTAGPPEVTTKVAVANIDARSDSKVSGTVTFTEADGKVTLVVELSGAAEGQHGFHLHETGDCSAPDGKSAGGHWNPTKVDHGKPGAPPHHRGDMGNLVVGADGKGRLSFTSSEWTLGGGADTDILNKAVIVHEKADDGSQPVGNAGARIGCGVIQLKK